MQIVRYEYDAWGKVISITGDRKDNLGKYNPFRYRHYMYDDSVGLYYLKIRHYYPALCRFLQADTVLGQASEIASHNLYSAMQKISLVFPGFFEFLHFLHFCARGFKGEKCSFSKVKG